MNALATVASTTVEITDVRDLSDRVELHRAVWTDPTTIWRRCVLYTALCHICGDSEDSTDEHRCVAWGEEHTCPPAYSCWEI